MKKLLAILLCMMLALPLCACTDMLEGLGSDNSTSNLTEKDLKGRYESKIAGAGNILEFDGEEEYELYFVWGIGSNPTSLERGTYSVDGDKITFYPENGSSVTMSIRKDGKNLIIDGNTWKYKK